MGGVMSAVSKETNLQFASRPPGVRLSELQRAILEVLEARTPGGIDAMVRTGDVIDALGRRRDKAGFASVSRSLGRLRAHELVLAWRSPFATRGDGCCYSPNTPEWIEAVQAARDRAWTGGL